MYDTVNVLPARRLPVVAVQKQRLGLNMLVPDLDQNSLKMSLVVKKGQIHTPVAIMHLQPLLTALLKLSYTMNPSYISPLLLVLS